MRPKVSSWPASGVSRSGCRVSPARLTPVGEAAPFLPSGKACTFALRIGSGSEAAYESDEDEDEDEDSDDGPEDNRYATLRPRRRPTMHSPRRTRRSFESDDSEDVHAGAHAASTGHVAALQALVDSDNSAPPEITLETLQTCFPYRFDRFQVRANARVCFAVGLGRL